MKKYLIISLLLFAPFFAKAEASTIPDNVYFFGDGKGYNENGDQKYFCFSDGSCYSLKGVFSFVREVQSTLNNLQNQVSDLQNQLTQINTMPKNQLVASTSELILAKQQIPESDYCGVESASNYFLFSFVGGKYTDNSSSTLEINGKTYTNGKPYQYKSRIGRVFDISLEPGTYPYTFTVSNDLYEGTYTGEVTIN